MIDAAVGPQEDHVPASIGRQEDRVPAAIGPRKDRVPAEMGVGHQFNVNKRCLSISAGVHNRLYGCQ